MTRLDDAWAQAIELAWDSYCARTTPVGAVVIDAGGAVVAAGRGRRYEAAADGRQLSNSHVAHAELNALALLPPDCHYEDHALLTTLEPCCMCLGAAVQATVRTLRFAGRDPYGGAAHVRIDTPQANRRPLTVLGPLEDARGRFAELLHVRWLIEFGASDPVLEPHRLVLPRVYAAAMSPDGASLREIADAGAPVREALVRSAALLGIE